MKLQKALITDISELKQICIDSYSRNFYDQWNEGGLEWYLEKEFSLEKLKSDLLSKDKEYYFIKDGYKNLTEEWPNSKIMGIGKIPQLSLKGHLNSCRVSIFLHS